MNVIQAVIRSARPAVVAIALVAFSPAAHSQQPSAAALATAKELVTLTGATSLFNPLIAGVIEQAKILFLQQDPTLNKDLTEVAAKLKSDMEPRFSEVTDEVARLYASRFTDHELKDILVFYQSPVGKKLLAQQSQIIDASMKFAQTWANKLSDEVVAKMRAEMQKRGHKL